MKKFLALLLAFPLLTLTACSGEVKDSNPSSSYGKEINQLKDTEKWGDKLEIKFYILGVDKIDNYLEGFANGKKGQEVIAVRYEIKNLTDKDIDLTGVNFGNGGFDNPSKPLGTLNYSIKSLHEKLKFPTFPSEWNSTGKWIVPAGQTVNVSLDWIVENEDYKMYYHWLMPFDKEYKHFDVTFKP